MDTHKFGVLVHRHMQGLYGSRWVDMWRSGRLDETGRDLGFENAVNTWGRSLSAMRQEQIMYALHHVENACKNPPTLPEFIGFCKAAPSATAKHLPAPVVTEEQKAKRSEEAKRMKQVKFAEPGKDWALRLRSMYLAGERLQDISIKYASEALGETWKDRKCTAITASTEQS